jgi:large subunit ribosomal protein L11
MGRKKLVTTLKLQLPAGQATPAPPVGTALGPHGINLMEFVKQYNDITGSQRGTIIPVEISIYEDRSFTFVTKTPPAAAMLRQAARVEKGSGVPHKVKVGSVSRAQVKEIARVKLPDLNANDIEAAMRIGPAKDSGPATRRRRAPGPLK